MPIADPQKLNLSTNSATAYLTVVHLSVSLLVQLKMAGKVVWKTVAQHLTLIHTKWWQLSLRPRKKLAKKTFYTLKKPGPKPRFFYSPSHSSPKTTLSQVNHYRIARPSTPQTDFACLARRLKNVRSSCTQQQAAITLIF